VATRRRGDWRMRGRRPPPRRHPDLRDRKHPLDRHRLTGRRWPDRRRPLGCHRLMSPPSLTPRRPDRRRPRLRPRRSNLRRCRSCFRCRRRSRAPPQPGEGKCGYVPRAFLFMSPGSSRQHRLPSMRRDLDRRRGEHLRNT
jgi:hypothetical protein